MNVPAPLGIRAAGAVEDSRQGTGKDNMTAFITRRQVVAQTLAGASALAAAPFSAHAAEQVGMQLILAADVSGSVSTDRYRTQQDGYLDALGDPRVLRVINELDPPVLAITFIAWAR